MADIQQSELRNQNAAIMRRVAAGESFVVTVHGRPVADLVPHRRESTRSRFVSVAVMADALAALPPVDTEAWARDRRDDDVRFGEDIVSDPHAAYPPP